MIVYRLEKNGIGPYMNRSSAYRVTKDRTKCRRVKKYQVLQQEYLKTRKDEHIDNYYKAHRGKEHIYGCKDKEQLKRYFYGDFKMLFKQGFRVKRYRVPDEEIIDMGQEVAFPVKYHKLQTVKAVQKKLETMPRFVW